MSLFWQPSTNIAVDRPTDTVVETNNDTGVPGRRYLGHALSQRQLSTVAVLVSMAFFLLAGRAFYLQVYAGASYRALAEGNRVRTTVIVAPRGNLYDAFGRSLTTNSPRLSLAVVPPDFPDDKEERATVFSMVAEASDYIADELAKAWEEAPAWRRAGAAPVIIANNIPLEEGLRLQSIAGAWPGIVVVTDPLRSYQTINEVHTSLSHLLGYVGRISEAQLAAESSYTPLHYVGQAGLEQQYEHLLRGVDGERKIEVNALGEELTLFSETAAIPGEDLWLTLDLDLQNAVETALRTGIERAEAKSGSVVVLDANTGGVLALVSLPSFDGNDFARGLTSEAYQALVEQPGQPLFHRAVQGRYPSGSTIKPVVAAAALADGIITSRTTFLSRGGLQVARWFFPDWRAGGHGVTDVKHALADSVNTFFYIVGGGYQNISGLGIERIAHYFRLFGLGTPTGIDLPGEAAGLVPTPEWKKEVKGEPWYIGDTYHAAIGQGDVLATPLQVARFTAAFANGGSLVKPHLYRSEEVSERTIPTVPSSIVAVVRSGLRQAVTQGSARRLSLLPVSSAGKTGTAEVGGNKEPHAWFTGFAPYESPEITVTVLVENGSEGSRFAVPVADEIIRWWIDNRFDRSSS